MACPALYVMAQCSEKKYDTGDNPSSLRRHGRFCPFISSSSHLIVHLMGIFFPKDSPEIQPTYIILR